MSLANAAIEHTTGTSDRTERALVVSRRRSGGGRAAVGGLLVVASAVGVIGAWGGGSSAPTDAYVALADDIVPGQRLTAGDLTRVRVELPTGQRRVAFTDPSVLVGTVALSGMRKGQLLQSADVAVVEHDADRVEVSVPVDRGSAMNGDRRFVRPGERVDVYLTASVDGTPTTRRVAGGAVVVDVLGGNERLGGGAALTIVLAVTGSEAQDVAGAAAQGKVALARVTGAGR